MVYRLISFIYLILTFHNITKEKKYRISNVAKYTLIRSISWHSQESCHSGTWDRKWGSCNFWLSFQRPTLSLLVSLLLSAYLFHSSLSLDLFPPNFCSGMVPHIWSSSKSVLQPLGTILDDSPDSRLPNTIFPRGESDCSSSSSSARPQESCIGH